MGTGRSSSSSWSTYASTVASKPASAIFHRGMHPDLDPSKIVLRESCDSVANPLSTPIIVGIDETGSMGVLAEILVKEGLGTLIEEIYNPLRKPVTDPHLMLMAIGDAWCDSAPLQVSQFEADNTVLAKQLENFFIEGNGGGNGYESYNIPWYFAATKCKTDSMLKRGKKGYLFTVGDEPPAPILKANHVKQFLGGGLQDDISTKDLLTMVSRDWEVFHIMVCQGIHYMRAGDHVKAEWRKLLGERAILLTDHTKMAEVIVSLIQSNEGADVDTVAKSWSGKTAVVVAAALKDLTVKNVSTGSSGVTRL